MNASLGQFSPMFRRLRPQGLKTIVNALLTRNLISRETQIYRITSNKPEREPEWVAKWAQIAGDSPVSLRTLCRQLLAAATYRPKTPPRGIPFVVCTSQGDRLVHPDCSERLAWWLGAKFKKHPSAGHDLPLDDPEWLAQVLMKWSKDG